MYDGIDAEGVDKQVNSWLVITTHNTKDRNAKRKELSNDGVTHD